MPRNTTGGSGHKAQRNTESSKARHNREFVDTLLNDIDQKRSTAGVYVGRVTKRMGMGRMEVFYVNDDGKRKIDMTQIVPMRGGLRGKDKRSVWVDVDNLVMIAETGLANTTHEIIAVFSAEQVSRFRAVCPHADERLFQKGTAGAAADSHEMGGFEIEEDEEVDVDAI